jgi:hypothetical protein
MKTTDDDDDDGPVRGRSSRGDKSKKGGLATGAIIGIVAGVLLLCTCFGCGGCVALNWDEFKNFVFAKYQNKPFLLTGEVIEVSKGSSPDFNEVKLKGTDKTFVKVSMFRPTPAELKQLPAGQTVVLRTCGATRGAGHVYVYGAVVTGLDPAKMKNPSQN